MINRKNLNKVWTSGQILVGVFIFFISFRELGFLKYVGMIGSIIWVVSQVIFLMSRRK